MLKTLNIPLEEFLRPFFDPGETVCLRVFDDRKNHPNKSADLPGAPIRTFAGAKLECEAGKIGSMVGTLRKHNAQNRGVYFVVNYGGHEDADITRINAQFVECDSKSFDEQEQAIAAFALPPSLVVRTRKSLHCYWLMKDARVEKYRRVQQALIAQFDGDPQCVNESRVFRLPGFHHCKFEPVMVECVKFNPELLYTQEQLLAALPDVPEEPAVTAPVPKGTRKGLSLVGKRCLFLQHCRDNAATLSEHDWYGMVCNLAVFVYEMQEDLAAQAAVRGYMIPRNATMTAITDAVGQWRMQVRKAVREINSNPFIVNVRNGLYNALDGTFKPHTADYFSTVAELFGKLANIFADLPSKNIDDGGMFKALTGEDYITAERKNKDPFSFRPYARLLFSCNDIPKNYSDRSDGFYRRLIIIRFDQSVPAERRDPNLGVVRRPSIPVLLQY